MGATAATLVGTNDDLNIPPGARQAFICHILPSGAVDVIETYVWREQGAGRPLRAATRPIWRHTIGYVNTDNVDAYLDAEHLIRRYGMRIKGQWTTLGRMPVCLLAQAS